MSNKGEYISPAEAYSIQKRKEVKAKEIEERIRRRNKNDLAAILALPEGRRFVHRLLVESKVFNSTFNNNTNVMCFNEGQRDIGLLFLNEVMDAKGSALMQMQNEFKSEQESIKQEIG